MGTKRNKGGTMEQTIEPTIDPTFDTEKWEINLNCSGDPKTFDYKLEGQLGAKEECEDILNFWKANFEAHSARVPMVPEAFFEAKTKLVNKKLGVLEGKCTNLEIFEKKKKCLPTFWIFGVLDLAGKREGQNLFNFKITVITIEKHRHSDKMGKKAINTLFSEPVI